MTQNWRNLLFLHWRFDPKLIDSTLPPGLEVDTFDGSAWVGIVPFQMERIRFLGCPLPGKLGGFPELNLRTYARLKDGRSAVWFYSLDADSPLAVWGGRTLFRLNYRNATMRVRENGRKIVFNSRCAGGDATDQFIWESPNENLRTASEGTLENFLLERYHLFARSRRTGKLFLGTVSHEPYRFRKVTPTQWTDHLFRQNGMESPGREPDSILTAPGFRVGIHPLRKV